jgi:hypothetical protein
MVCLSLGMNGERFIRVCIIVGAVSHSVFRLAPPLVFALESEINPIFVSDFQHGLCFYGSSGSRSIIHLSGMNASGVDRHIGTQQNQDVG